MYTSDPILGLMDRFTAALNAHDLDAVLALVTEDIVFESTSPPPDGTRYEGRAAVARAWGDLLASTPKARFAVEEQFSDGSERAVVRWRYDWGEGHVRGVDIVLGPRRPARRKPGLRQGVARQHSRPQRPRRRLVPGGCRAGSADRPVRPGRPNTLYARSERRGRSLPSGCTDRPECARRQYRALITQCEQELSVIE